MFNHLKFSIRGGNVALAAIVIAGTITWSIQADGLSGEYLVTQRWRTLQSQYSPLTNPAFLTEANYVEARFVGSRTLQEFGMLDLGVTIPVRLYQSFGASLLYQGSDPFYESGTDASDPFKSGTSKIRDFRTQTMLSYAVNPISRLSLGLNLNIAYESFFRSDDNRAGWGVDLGLSYRLLHHQLLGDHVAGIAFQNVLPVTFKPADDSLRESSWINRLFGRQSADTSLPYDHYPSVLRLSLVSSFWERQITTGFDFSLKDLYAQANDFANGDKSIEWDLNCRASVWILRLFKLYLLCGLDGSDGFEYWGFAPAFDIPAVLTGHELEVAYQFVSVRKGVANTSSFYVRGEIGKHREELYARRMARLANIEPNDLYNRALTLFSKGMYWDAFFVFGRIQVEYPDFFKRDWVDYYLGACQEKLDMRTSSAKRYEQVRQDYAKSIVKPFAELGLMRIEYRNNNSAAVRSLFDELNKPDVPDSLKFHGFYIMGQSLVSQKEFQKAVQLFEQIPEYHPDYVFAQHSLAVCKATVGTLEAAIPYLENAIQSMPSTKAQEEIINRSFVLIGYIFYESAGETEGALSRAVTAFRRVPKTSVYFEDAVLGMGWTALKARQWQDCFNAGNRLKTSSKRAGLRAEGGLLMAYSELMRKRYSPAATILEETLRGIEGYRAVTADSLAELGQEYENTRVEYRSVAEAANDLASNRQSTHVLNQIDSVGIEQVSAKQSIDEYLDFLDDNYRDLFFARTLEQITEDVQYALAQAKKMSSTRKTSEDTQKMQTKQQKLDDEILKLEKQMRSIEDEQKLDKGGK